eukprot:gene33495-44851_t
MLCGSMEFIKDMAAVMESQGMTEGSNAEPGDFRLKGLSVEEARARMLAHAVVRPAEKVALDADERVLAESVTALRDQPPFDASAMDGWAVRRADVESGGTLVIAGESAAGR